MSEICQAMREVGHVCTHDPRTVLVTGHGHLETPMFVCRAAIEADISRGFNIVSALSPIEKGE